MPYLGNPAVDRFTSTKAASVYSGDGSTVAFTLEHSVGADEDILVSVDGVIQEPSVAYAVSSGTTLTFTAAPSTNSGNNIFVYYLFRTIGTVTHPPTSALSATSGTFSTTLAVTGNATIGASSAPSLWSSSNNFVISDTSSDGGMAILSGTSGNGNVMFSDTTAGAFSDARGLITYLHASDDMRFMTANTEHMRINSTGAVTMPLQPAFLAVPASGQTNLATGTVIVFGTEKFDQNADFASNTFTAPVTGKYQLNFMGRVDQIDTAANWQRLVLVTSNTTYQSQIIDLGGLSGDPNYWNFNINVLADMDASDTAFIKWEHDGGSNVADMTEQAFFSGYLVA